MKINEAIEYALDGHALLFAGSGFSYGAININDEPFKTGLGLRDLLAKECGLTDCDDSLELVSLLYKKMFSAEELISLLKTQYSLKKVQNYHKDILSVPWKRVYTTNYDRVIEEAALKNRKTITPIVLGDILNDYSKDDICVHFNGYIDRLNITSLDTDFKLTDRSYASDTLKGNDWYEFFKSDLKSSKAIFIVGFSMKSDLDIKRLLAPPEISRKVVFITKSDLEQLSLLLLEEYGETYQIGLDGFALNIKEISNSYTPSLGLPSYNSFSFESMKPLLPETVGLDDCVNLFFLGKMQDKFLQKSPTGEYKYLIYRDSLNYVRTQIWDKKVFLIVSDLGNGKSIFCNLLRNELKGDDVNLFTLNKELLDIDEEIENICSIRNKRSIIFIENYYMYAKILKRFSQFNIRNLTFILTARKAINRFNHRKIVELLGIDENMISPIILDNLSDKEIADLSYMLKSNSLLSKKMPTTGIKDISRFIKVNCKSKLSNVLLELFDSSDIKGRLIDLYKNGHTHAPEIKEISIFGLMKSTMNLNLDFIDMCDILNLDYIKLGKDDNEYLNEVFDFNNDNVYVKSSIIAKALFYSIIDFNSIIQLMIKIVISASESYKGNPNYEQLLKNIVSHTHFVPFISDKNNVLIKLYYDRIRNTEFCKENPFFWEQFASACIDTKDFITAKQCLTNAYVEASKKYDFIPFQIETVDAKCIMEELLFDSNFKKLDAEDIIQRILQCHGHLLKYYDHPENNPIYVFKVGSNYCEIYNKCKSMFDRRQKSILLEKTIEITKLLDAYRKTSLCINIDLANIWYSKLDLMVSELKK